MQKHEIIIPCPLRGIARNQGATEPDIKQESSSVNGASFCCLCFHEVEVDMGFQIQEEVAITGQTLLKMTELLSYVLGDQFVSDMYTVTESTTLCQQCAQDASSTYKFIKMCKRNYEMRSNRETVKTYLEIQLKEEDHDSSSDSDKKFDVDEENHSEAENKHIAVKKEKLKKTRAKKIDLSHILHNKSTSEELKCKFCLKLFSRAKNLRCHYVRVHAPKDFKCPDCPLSYGSELYLHIHRKLNHKQVVCSQCGKSFTNIHTMRRHEKSHVLRYTCADCEKVYKTKQALKHHIKMKLCGVVKGPTMYKKFRCAHCNKKYTRKDTLQEHIRFMHMNGTCYTCTWCNKKLNSYSRLQEHIVVHTKDKKFTCKLCGGKFVSKSSLLYHTRTHTGDLPYKCEYCDESFLNKSRRTQHFKRKHMSDLKCDICLDTFTCESSLWQHKQMHSDPSSMLHDSQSDNMETNEEEPTEVSLITECITVIIKEERDDIQEDDAV